MSVTRFLQQRCYYFFVVETYSVFFHYEYLSRFFIEFSFDFRKFWNMIVQVEEGRLRGVEKKPVLTGQPYCAFLGIPYAKPSIGDLRFKVSSINV